MNEVVVSAKNISKKYKLYNKPIDRVKESLNPFSKKYHEGFYAAKDISLELRRGEALGVIGRNGHGKSTLLKLIAGVLTPTEGSIKTTGKISAILELTSNLRPELTGIENIVFNMKINGLAPKTDLNIKVRQIEEFAELGEYIKQPVKTYSSGMKSRLGFGIATALNPDILILDEVLAVGDFKFQQKCLSKINSMRDDISVVFVSHSMNSIRLFCDRVVVLEKGGIKFDGIPGEAIKFYLEQNDDLSHNVTKKASYVKSFYGELFHNSDAITDISHYWTDNKGNRIAKSRTGDTVRIYVRFKLLYKPKNLILGIPFWNSKGRYITGMATDVDDIKLHAVSDNLYEVMLVFENVFNPEVYINVVTIFDGAEALYRGHSDDLEVINTDSRYFGDVMISHSWKQAKNPNDDKILDINNIKLTIDNTNSGGLAYEGKSSYEEINNLLYADIYRKFRPDIVIDIGANYGFTGIVFSKVFQESHIVFIEADMQLCEYIEKNCQQNNLTSYKIINSICSDKDGFEASFSLSPYSNQDNRVIGENEKWRQISVPTVTLNNIIKRRHGEFYFIKIDTQGYEEFVLKGGWKFISQNSNWLIKMEFAPYWLKSQGTSPESFLGNLIDHFSVAEWPARTLYKENTVETLLNKKIKNSDVKNFIAHIEKHNRNQLGWCDLLVFPKNL